MLPTIEFSDPSVARIDKVKYWEIIYSDGSKEGSETDTGEILDRSRVNIVYGSPIFGNEIKYGWFTESYTGGDVVKVIKPAFCKSITLHGVCSKTLTYTVTVVEKESDLPSPSEASETLAYFVTETSTLYVASDSWITVSTGSVYTEGQSVSYTRDDFKSWIKFIFEENIYLYQTNMVLSYTQSNLTESPEISRHRVTDDKKSDTSVNNTSPEFSSCGFLMLEHYAQINGSNFCVSKRDYLERSKPFINNLLVDNLPEFQSMAMTKAFQKFFIGSYMRQV